jgi:hypothetical protein
VGAPVVSHRVRDAFPDATATYLWSAEIKSGAGRRKNVFVMQPAKDGIGMDDKRFAAAMARIGKWTVDIGERRVRDNSGPPELPMEIPAALIAMYALTDDGTSGRYPIRRILIILAERPSVPEFKFSYLK